MKWFIPGNVPSSKNGRRWTGRYFVSSKATTKYRKATAKYYEQLYDIKGTWLDSSKDIADLVKEKGFSDAHKEIKVKLKSVL